MNNIYLIPANSKKGMLKLNLFTNVDLIILGVGVGLTVLLIIALQAMLSSLGGIFLVLLPAIIAVFLVFPIPNYHNVLQLIINIITFFSEQRVYKWKGWCYKNERK